MFMGHCVVSILVGLLVYYNYKTICDDCRTGFNSTTINNVKSCAGIFNGTISSYDQCHIYYQEPGFGFGCFMLAICWIAIGAPVIIVDD